MKVKDIVHILHEKRGLTDAVFFKLQLLPRFSRFHFDVSPRLQPLEAGILNFNALIFTASEHLKWLLNEKYV